MNVVDFLGVVTMAMTTLRMLGARFKEAEVGFLGHVNNYRLYIYIYLFVIYTSICYTTITMVTIIISWFIDYSYVYNIYIYIYTIASLELHFQESIKSEKNNAGSVLHIIIIHTRALTA
jgi:hypothetical protein